jgi:DNA-binding beta-propeller fold protein YncE
MMMSNKQKQHLKTLLQQHERRLRVLETRAATAGMNTPPEVVTEIEDIRSEIARLIEEIAKIEASGEEDIALPFPPTPWVRLFRQSRIIWGVGVPILLLSSIFLVGRSSQWWPSDVPTPTSTSPTAMQPAQPTTVEPTSAGSPALAFCEHERQIKPKSPDEFGKGIVANLDANGNLYVADKDKKRILKLPLSSTDLEVSIPTGDATTQIGNPLGVAIDKDGNVYVTQANQIQKFNRNGQLVEWPKGGFGDGQFKFPTGIAVDSERGYVYVADSGNNRIQQFYIDGRYKYQWGKAGHDDGQFNDPTGIAVDSERGYVYVADSGNNRIQKFDSNGSFLKWGNTANHAGKGNGEFNEPLGVAVDNIGNVYVADSGNGRIQKLNHNGEFLGVCGKPGNGDGELMFPRAVSVDSNGKIYVADSANKRIQIFRPK